MHPRVAVGVAGSGRRAEAVAGIGLLEPDGLAVFLTGHSRLGQGPAFRPGLTLGGPVCGKAPS